jgi:hypothetical protein
VLAKGSPAEVRARAKVVAGREATMEDAFISIVQEGRSESNGAGRKEFAR